MDNLAEQIINKVVEKFQLQLEQLRKEMEVRDQCFDFLAKKVDALNNRIDDDFREGEQWKDASGYDPSVDIEKPVEPAPVPELTENQKKIRDLHELEQAEARNAEKAGTIIRDTTPVTIESVEPVKPGALVYGWKQCYSQREICCLICEGWVAKTGQKSLSRSYRRPEALVTHLWLKHHIEVPMSEVRAFVEGGGQ